MGNLVSREKGRRTVYLEGFRGHSLQYHPQILLSLPAKVEANLEEGGNFAALNKEIESLGVKIRQLSVGDKG